MKQLVKVEEVASEGLVSFLGKRVTLLCLNYFYTGKLVGVNDEYCKLEDPSIVYETGPFGDGEWKDAQSLPSPHYVMKGSVESFGTVKVTA